MDLQKDCERKTISKNLDLQRVLALKALSRADDRSRDNPKSNNCMSISYLLKPNESAVPYDKNASLNPSDVFNISDMISDISPAENAIDVDTSQSSAGNINLSQSVQDILAASCLKDVQDSVLALDDINSKYPMDARTIDDLLSDSISCEAGRNSWTIGKQSIQGLENVSFESFNEEVNKRMLSDEQEWRQQFADIPQKNNKLNFSEFSGFLPSSGNKLDNNKSSISFGEFFQGHTENLDNILSSCSPPKSKPVPLLDIQEVSLPSFDANPDQIVSDNGTFTSSKKLLYEEKALPQNASEIASLSTIARALNVLTESDSPQTMINLMMKNASRIPESQAIPKKPINMQIDDSIIAGSIASKSNKENSNPNTCSASSSTLNSTSDFIGMPDNFIVDLDEVTAALHKASLTSLAHNITGVSTEINTNNIQNSKSSKSSIHNSIAKNIPTITCDLPQEKINSQDRWVKPKDVIKKNQSTSNHCKQEASNCKKVKSDEKFEESVIIIHDDSEISSQDLEIGIEESAVASFPLWCPLYVPIKLQSNAEKILKIKTKFINLIFNDQKVSTTSDFIRIELPTKPVILEPRKKNILTVKVWGFCAGHMSVTLLLEDLTTTTKQKSVRHTFQIDFFKPSVSLFLEENMQESVDLVSFGHMPQKSSKTINLIISNNGETSLPLKAKLHCENKAPFSIISDAEDGSFSLLEKEMHLLETTPCKLHFRSDIEKVEGILNHGAVLNIGLYLNDEFILIKSCNITGSICQSNILFRSEDYPLHLEFGETRPVSLFNNGTIDLSYVVHVGCSSDDFTPCSEGIFSINQKMVTVKKNEMISLQVTLDKDLLKTTERILVFQQTLDGPSYIWPLIGKSRTVQNYLKKFKSPTGICKKLGKNSVSPDGHRRNKLDFNNKVSPNKVAQSDPTGSNLASGSSQINRLPIRSMKTKMSWPSVKIGKTMLQEVTIKNTSEYRIKININLSSIGFSFSKNNDISNSMTLLLQGLEVRSLSVVFSPQTTGIYIGKMVFSDSNSKAYATIPLFGFGGTSDISVRGVFKHPNGSNFLPMGEFNALKPMQKTIHIYNNGSVSAFAYVACSDIKNKFVLSTNEITVTPSIMIIEPNKYKTVDICFRPKKDYISHTKGEVVELATLTLMTGDEGLRQRARCLYQKNTFERSDNIWKKLLPIFVEIPNETTYHELEQIKEPMSALYDIIEPLDIKEIFITIEKHSKQSSDMTVFSIDESQMFQSLCIESESLCESILQTWSFEPNRITLSLPCVTTKVVKITNCYSLTQNYEVAAHPLFKIKPTCGAISGKGSVSLVVSYTGGLIKKNMSTSIQILAENDVINIPVDILLIL